MILPDINVTVREVSLPVDQYGWEIRIDHRKGRSSADVMAVLNRWLERWAKRRGKWLCNEARLRWWRDLCRDEPRLFLKWAAVDAPPGEAPGRRLDMPKGRNSITYRVFEQ